MKYIFLFLTLSIVMLHGMENRDIMLADIALNHQVHKLRGTLGRVRSNSLPALPVFINSQYAPHFVHNQTQHFHKSKDIRKANESLYTVDLAEDGKATPDQLKPGKTWCSHRTQIFLAVGMATAFCTGVGGVMSAIVTLIVHFTS